VIGELCNMKNPFSKIRHKKKANVFLTQYECWKEEPKIQKTVLFDTDA